MGRILPVVIGGSLGILLFDTLGSLASKRFGFAYTSLTIGSMLIYAATGYFAGRTAPLATAALAAILVGVVEATLGWAISWKIGPGRTPSGLLTPADVVTALLFVVFLAGACGAAGAWLGSTLRAK